MDPKRHALYMRPFGHLCDHTPLEDVLQDVLEDVFGLPPRPHTDGHDGPWAASRSMGGGPKNKDEDGGPKIVTRIIIWRFEGKRGGGITKSYCFQLV